MGAEAIKKLLESSDLDKLAKELRSELKMHKVKNVGKLSNV